MDLPAWNGDRAATVQALAAIMQAVLTIVALGIAIGVPWWQGYRERKRQAADRRERSVAVAIMLLPHVMAIQKEAQQIASLLHDNADAIPRELIAKSVDTRLETALRLNEVQDSLCILPAFVHFLVARLRVATDRYAQPGADKGVAADEVASAAGRVLEQLNNLIAQSRLRVLFSE